MLLLIQTLCSVTDTIRPYCRVLGKTKYELLLNSKDSKGKNKSKSYFDLYPSNSQISDSFNGTKACFRKRSTQTDW